MKDVKLSIIIISYKQEKYIKEAIESVLKQKVNFNYEIILADDCSPDNTFKVMEKYAKKYPDKIRLLKREKNLGATKNQLDACNQSKGEYITLLEGDDYWLDENKIQKQVDFLDNNKEYIGVSHYRQGRNLDNEILGNFPKEVKETCDVTIEDYVNGTLKFPESATVYRNLYLDKKHKKNIEYLCSLHDVISDTQLCIYLLSLGKVKMLAEPLMVYRIRSKKGESNFNSTHKISQIQMSYLEIYLALDEFFKQKYDFYIKFEAAVTLGFIYAFINLKFKEAFTFIKKCPKKYRVKIILLMPINGVKIILKKLRRRR